MPQDRVDLEKRLRVIRPTDTVKGSLFNGICAALQSMAPEDPVARQLVARHRKTHWSELTDHPVADYLTLVIDAAEVLEPRFGGPVQALRAVGAVGGRAFLGSLIGRLAVRAVANQDPIDVLSHAPRLYGASASYGNRWFTRVSDRVGIFHCHRDFLPPDYHVGLVPEGAQVNGHRVQIEANVYDLLDADYRVTWDGRPPVTLRRAQG
jgi:uncharacterized protein (TIGR02265 family)